MYLAVGYVVSSVAAWLLYILCKNLWGYGDEQELAEMILGQRSSLIK